MGTFYRQSLYTFIFKSQGIYNEEKSKRANNENFSFYYQFEVSKRENISMFVVKKIT